MRHRSLTPSDADSPILSERQATLPLPSRLASSEVVGDGRARPPQQAARFGEPREAGLRVLVDAAPGDSTAGAAPSSLQPDSLTFDDPMALYLRDISQAPLLTADQETELAQQREAGASAAERLTAGVDDPAERAQLEAAVRTGGAAEQRLIESNLRLVVSIARKYVNRGLPLLDLIQEGNIGLKRGVDRYDWRLGFRFSTYVFWWIRQAVVRALAEQSRLIRLPVHVSEQLGRMHTAVRDLEAELSREPTSEEIAARLGVDASRALALQRAAVVPTSLESTIDASTDLRLADLIADANELTPVEQAEQDVLADELDEALHAYLSPREATLIQWRFGLRGARPRTLAEIGDDLGVSRERARQLESSAMRKLRHAAPVLRLLHDYAS